ncbi:MAG: PadR family transcriptional regulator [Pseudomonadota bacterium]
MKIEQQKALQREILLAFWKVHILHHAGEGPVVGQWMMAELRRHGYEVSPGTLYPILHRMEKLGWLRCEFDPGGGPKAKKSYFLAELGRQALEAARTQLKELKGEVGDNIIRERERKEDSRK